MRKLILIKHARPDIDPAKPSSAWQLSKQGQDACLSLAKRLESHELRQIVSSTEPKASQTAQILARELSLPLREIEDLHEHQRDTVGHMQTREFLSTMAMVFKNPHRKVLGEESADHAQERFLRALDNALQLCPEGNLGVVSHGTVIALTVAYHTGQDAYLLWRRMALPSFVVLELPDYRLAEIWPAEERR